MLQINWADVEGVLLTDFGIAAVLAVIVMIVCRSMTRAKKHLVRCEAGLAILLALAVTVNLICFGPMSSMIDLVTGGGSIFLCQNCIPKHEY